MDFARKQMEKYGWEDGEGLGKAGNQGITFAIKPHYKTGKEGMGFDISKELVDTWWTRAYSDSLSRINVDATDEGQVTVSTPGDEDSSDIDRPMAKMRKKMLKANFTDFAKGAILSNGELVDTDKPIDHSVPKSKEEIVSFNLTDEQLLKACGGRTAHKAARFGMKLSGKLARIASQEDSLFSQDVYSKPIDLEPDHLDRKSKKRKKKNAEIINDEVTLDPELDDDINEISKKKKKKRKRRLEEEQQTNDTILESPILSEDLSEDLLPKMKKSKKHKKKRQNLI